jgi:indole-3-glycerol phosphate synthase
VTTTEGVLGAIAARKRAEVERLRCAEPALWAKAESLPPARAIADALRGGTIIAEMKRRSPSGGVLRPELDPLTIARDYAACGVAAISVLTDGPDFGGALDDLAEVRAAVDLPLLRKDFTLDPVQVAEARVAGADWVLLIVALLDTGALDHCLAGVARSRAQAIVEVHDVDEARTASRASASTIATCAPCKPTSPPSHGCAPSSLTASPASPSPAYAPRRMSPGSRMKAPMPSWSARR